MTLACAATLSHPQSSYTQHALWQKKGPEQKVGFDAAKILAADAKAGIGKTGAELRYHTKTEVWELPEKQQREVADYNLLVLD